MRETAIRGRIVPRARPLASAFCDVIDDWGSIPIYASDLNACAEMRKQIDTPEKKVKFLNTLRFIVAKRIQRSVSDFDMIDSLPSEQTEATLRTLNLWKE